MNHFMRALMARLRGLFGDRRAELEFDDEIETHLRLLTERYVRQGMTEAEATLTARRQFGNVTLLREAHREMRGIIFIDTLFQDLQYGVRMLRKNPGFTLIAALTLCLGIGVNTAIFSVVNALMLRPLPFPDPERLVFVEVNSGMNTGGAVEGGLFLDWQEQSRTLEGIAAINSGKTRIDKDWGRAHARRLIGSGETEIVEVGQITASFFSVLGVQPLPPGRNFIAAEDRRGSDRVAILSHGLWQRRYNGDPEIVGKTITLDAVKTKSFGDLIVVGVAPASFRYFHPFDVWVPMGLDPQRERAIDAGERAHLPVVARIKPGVTLEQARVELDTILLRYEMTRPGGKPRVDLRTRLVPLQEYYLGDTRRPLLVLLGAVGLILLIACANVANLLLARTLTRQKELAVRAALGAGRLRLTRQMLTECLLLAIAGGAAGLLLASLLTRLLALTPAITLGEMSRMAAITIDWRVLGFTMLISLVTGLLFGLLPALRFSRPDLNVALKEGGNGGGFHGRGARNALMVSEVALAVVLLVGAGLLIRSFVKLTGVDPGYRAENVLTARLHQWDGEVHYYEQTLQRLAALPGIDAAGGASHLPLTGYNWRDYVFAEGHEPQQGEPPPIASITAVNPDYFRAMGISLRAGRLLNDGDNQGSPLVAALSETLARRLFPNENPIGKRIKDDNPRQTLWPTVIGVVNDVRHEGLGSEVDLTVYYSYRQSPRRMYLVLHSAVAPSSLIPAVRKAVRDVDPARPVFDVMTMSERLSNSIAARRFYMSLLTGFAALALLLAGVGVYGVISYVVTQRTHEVGIRMALGAQSADVARLFIKQGMAVVLLGLGLGLLGAFALTRVMRGLLFGVGATDPLTFASVALLLSLIALLACYLPARRAARIDPLLAIRHE
jgi:putative ABC transport system permease protein